MKIPQFYITVILGALCVVLSVASILITKSSQNLQAQFQAQQEEINKGELTSKIGQNLLRDIAELSMKNPKIAEVLKSNGYTVNTNPSAPATPSATPAQ